MIRAAEILLWCSLGLVAVPTLTFTLQVLLALLPARSGRYAGTRPSCAVLIPAHDEAGLIGPTVRSVLAQMAPGDRVIVVADNCTDSTAAEAASAGATVVSRTNNDLRGKGHALAAGVESLREDAPPVAVVLDADCSAAPGSIDRLVRACWEQQRPIQAAYLMRPPPNASVGDRVSALAFRFKNAIRPRGLRRVNAPCLLTGSGMAFVYQQLAERTLATGDIVEDMRLGVDLSIAGYPPVPMPNALVTSELPGTADAKRTQRTRWEHGHLTSILSHAPRLVATGLAHRRIGLVALAVELSVPPMSLLLVLTTGIASLTFAGWLAGMSISPMIVAGALLASVTLTALLGWWRFGRDDVRPRDLLFVPVYAVAKIPIYVRAITNRQKSWVRTARDPQDPDACTR